MPDFEHGGRVRDPVHGYVAFTGLERELFAERAVQRLRYISQSGAAHMVFPEVRTTRFSHSLGAMHLASKFLASCLHNADPAVRARIEDAVEAAVEEASGGLGLPEGLKTLVYSFGRQGLTAGAAVREDRRVSTLLVEQGLRLAALSHDLGHLPYSHDFEYALGDVIADHREAFPTLGDPDDARAIHERIGYSLSKILQRRVFGAIGDDPGGQAVSIAFQLARKILEAEAPAAPVAPATQEEGLFRWLHTLIAGEVDVDRCDYILRDTRHYGFEFASYDLLRLVDNLVVVAEPDAEHALTTAVLPQGQSAVESFLIARFRMYQWGVRHHKVAQVGAALRWSIRELLRDGLAGGGANELRTFVDDIETIAAAEHAQQFLTNHADVLGRFVEYDDPWWLAQMRRAAAIRDEAWLKLACFREPGPTSLWKRINEFPAESLRDWNARLYDLDDDEARSTWQNAVDALEQDGVLVVRHVFKSWESGGAGDGAESDLCICHGARLIPLTEVSYPVKSLREAWMNDIQVHAFAREPGLLTKEAIIDRLPLVEPPDQDGAGEGETGG